MSDERKGHWIQTVSGRPYWPLDPRPAEVFIEDIAHALAMLCRYTGHTKYFYSVAEHSVLVSQCVPPHLALVGLLHDAPEAYINDIARPVKVNLVGYAEIEDANWRAVAQRFGLPDEMPPEVKTADIAVLYAEKAQLMAKMSANALEWGKSCGEHDPRAADVQCRVLLPIAARQLFIRRYNELTKGTPA
jgi:uncharacterized protein